PLRRRGIMDKVYGGTPQGSQSLCLSCRWAQNVEGINMQHQSTCLRTTPTQIVRFPVAKCSGYDDKNLPSLQRMMECAWDIKTTVKPVSGFLDGVRKVEITPPDPNRP